MSQTSVQINTDKGQAGLLADLSNKTADTRDNPNSVIPFGRGVARDGADRAVKLTDDGADLFIGVALHTHNVEQNPSGQLGVAEYAVQSAVPVLTKGKIWVPVEDVGAIDETAAVFVRFVAGGGGSLLGVFRTDADTASAFEITDAKWVGITDTGLAMLEINLP